MGAGGSGAGGAGGGGNPNGPNSPGGTGYGGNVGGQGTAGEKSGGAGGAGMAGYGGGGQAGVANSGWGGPGGSAGANTGGGGGNNTGSAMSPVAARTAGIARPGSYSSFTGYAPTTSANPVRTSTGQAPPSPGGTGYGSGGVGAQGNAGEMSGGAGGAGMAGFGGGGIAGVANSGWGGPGGSAGRNTGGNSAGSGTGGARPGVSSPGYSAPRSFSTAIPTQTRAFSMAYPGAAPGYINTPAMQVNKDTLGTYKSSGLQNPYGPGMTGGMGGRYAPGLGPDPSIGNRGPLRGDPGYRGGALGGLDAGRGGPLGYGGVRRM